MRKQRIWLSGFCLIIFALIILLLNKRGHSFSDFFSYWNTSKIYVAFALACIATVLLLFKKVNLSLRIFFLFLIFFIFGVASNLPLKSFAQGLGLHPSPMCVIEKPFLFAHAGKTIPLIFLAIFTFIGLLSVLSNKSFCGWACPIGALQELFFHIPFPKKFKIPFRISNSIRVFIFLAFIILLAIFGFSLYGYLNAFHVLHWSWQFTLIFPILIAFVGGILFFRPFCYLVCPLGLVTWGLEQFSFIRVKVNKSLCTDCKICIKKSKCPAVESILEERKLRPDCFTCARCIQVCPEKALDFKI